ncbi:MAG: hypothetical protein Q9166_004020 [cf. Caloplaca sp. 2 TL-2023]
MLGHADGINLRPREEPKTTAGCASCHGLAGLTDPSSWRRDMKERGTSWDNTPREDKRNILGLQADSRLQKRGTNWDGTHGEDKRDARENTIDKSLWGRGTVWENILAEDKRDALGLEVGTSTDLGPKVGQGGKLQPLYGNDWELSRRAADMKNKGRVPMPAGLGGGCIICLSPRIKRWLSSRYASSLYPSGSWKGQNGGKPTQLFKDIKLRARSTEDGQGGVSSDGGKPMPAQLGGCVNCLRKRMKRWVSTPFASSCYPSGNWLDAEEKDGGKPTSLVRRGEDMKGNDSGKPKPGAGVPMPLCVNCWFRKLGKLKRCISTAKESGWNHSKV